MPEVGERVMVFMWMDNAVYQAWWNGEHYVLAAADAEGTVNIYKVLPEAITHWQPLPLQPSSSKAVKKHMQLVNESRAVH
jgi:hypothetical protein